METYLNEFFQTLKIGNALTKNNMTIFPIFLPLPVFGKYISLKKALSQQKIKFTESSEWGSVPELMVNNLSQEHVLILDGEELVGAKQNRVLNTTVLLKRNSKIIIPVSCTEQGRWAYVSKEFDDSGNLLAANLRRRKISSVSDNLNHYNKYYADQNEVWNGVKGLSDRLNVSSSTMALSDVFKKVEQKLDAYLRIFAIQTEQRGLLVAINGEIIGFDFISNPQVYAELHPKLIKSYAIEAEAVSKKKEQIVGGQKAKNFLKKALESKTKKFKGVSLGREYRFMDKKLVGSVLVYRKKVIHAALFTKIQAIKSTQSENNLFFIRRFF